MDSNLYIQDILAKLIQPEYLKYYADWHLTANDREKKGLKLLAGIMKHKGMKKFRADPPSVQLETLHKQTTFDMKKAEEMFRKSQTTSFYMSDYCTVQKTVKPENNIFRFRKCSEMEFKNVLTKLAVQFIDNWIALKDELEFEELVLSCLRSLHARFKSLEVSRTEAKSQFTWNVDWKLCKPIRIDKVGEGLKTYKTNYQNTFNQNLKKEARNDEIHSD